MRLSWRSVVFLILHDQVPAICLLMKCLVLLLWVKLLAVVVTKVIKAIVISCYLLSVNESLCTIEMYLFNGFLEVKFRSRSLKVCLSCFRKFVTRKRAHYGTITDTSVNCRTQSHQEAFDNGRRGSCGNTFGIVDRLCASFRRVVASEFCCPLLVAIRCGAASGGFCVCAFGALPRGSAVYGAPDVIGGNKGGSTAGAAHVGVGISLRLADVPALGAGKLCSGNIGVCGRDSVVGALVLPMVD